VPIPRWRLGLHTGRQLATRLFVLFVLAAAVPLALSDWVSTTAVNDVAEGLSERNRAQTTRQTSRQVFDRLMAGKTMLQAAPLELPIPGVGSVFARASRIGPDGQTAWSSDGTGDLLADWQAAAPKTAVHKLRDRTDEVQLRVAQPPGQPMQVLLATLDQGRVRRLAQLQPSYLWAPLEDASDDSSWQVRDSLGQLLAQRQGSGKPSSLEEPHPSHRSMLFLVGEFDSLDWYFEQQAPSPVVHWQGQRLSLWLGLVGLGTLLGITLLSRWQIRCALIPLAELTEGARQLADGATTTRVRVVRGDEIGSLATAFNHMAGRIAEREHELVHRAVHDSLTGLPNRDGLHERLDALLNAPEAAPLAVMFIDLDHFKDVNDSCGHEAGDELLCLSAGRLREAAPACAFVSRLGGDEFVLLLPGADAAQAASVAQASIARLSQPFALRDGEHLLGASVGIALSPAHGRSREELLRCADIALNAAKAEGRGRHAEFRAELNELARNRVLLQAELRRALAEGEFTVHYQPRVRPHDGLITSAEALIRWQHPTRGLLYPGSFIEVAEGCGLIEGIGHWVLDATCAQIAAWREQGLALEHISVNVSPRQLATGELLGQVRAAIDRHRIPPQALELEVTESLLVGDASQACDQLSELRRWGVSIALDDFGTGYSSMATLRQLPIDVMKVDRSFVVDLGIDDGAMAVTCAIIAMARSLHLRLVAEGIETECQAQVLRSMGVDELQGYLYSKPVPPEAFVRLPGLPQPTGAAL
jgi:diguanylate cyclase (GGDEF)-like protein